MRDAARQLSDGLHLAGLQQLLAGALEQFLRFSLGSDVAGDLGEADQRALLIVDRFEDGTGGKTAAVLSDAPALGDNLPLLGGFTQHLRRRAGALFLLGVKARKVLPDDLVGAVALDALRAAIPGGDSALRIEHVDRIIGDRFDQDAELPFGFMQFLLQGVARR